ncbi:uncharacterized protein LOC123265879 [Cotesia glomerata]|uniref:Uncharacterized protein n=1 Tax=Cotesia glomerata TaxID=32391 RepID=A0AAV7IX60_COTGL|nr:uncharacterized protein LOC123265879 [Cotesia glomerata]KAH0561432.1 hypothetical protein KQX54_016747 [Cotesia glomerata]
MTNLRNTMESVDPQHYERLSNYVDLFAIKYSKMKKNFNKFMIDARVYEILDQILKYLMSHPILTAFCVLLVATFVIPIFLFISFALINVAFALTGFIVVEVAVLTVGATVLCSIFFCILTTIVGIGIMCALTWSVVYYFLTVLRNIRSAQ